MKIERHEIEPKTTLPKRVLDAWRAYVTERLERKRMEELELALRAQQVVEKRLLRLSGGTGNVILYPNMTEPQLRVLDEALSLPYPRMLPAWLWRNLQGNDWTGLGRPDGGRALVDPHVFASPPEDFVNDFFARERRAKVHNFLKQLRVRRTSAEAQRDGTEQPEKPKMPRVRKPHVRRQEKPRAVKPTAKRK